MFKEISKKIARGIMKVGDAPNSPTQRIEFKGGYYNLNEVGQGGLCEAALAERVEIVLRDILAQIVKDGE